MKHQGYPLYFPQKDHTLIGKKAHKILFLEINRRIQGFMNTIEAYFLLCFDFDQHHLPGHFPLAKL